PMFAGCCGWKAVVWAGLGKAVGRSWCLQSDFKSMAVHLVRVLTPQHGFRGPRRAVSRTSLPSPKFRKPIRGALGRRATGECPYRRNPIYGGWYASVWKLLLHDYQEIWRPRLQHHKVGR